MNAISAQTSLSALQGSLRPAPGLDPGGRGEAGSSRPAIIPRGLRLPVRFCRECGHPFYPARLDQEFCLERCRKHHHQRRARRGTEVYDLVMTWRRDRVRGAFTSLTQTVANWLAEDRDREAAHKALRDAWNRQQKAARPFDHTRMEGEPR